MNLNNLKISSRLIFGFGVLGLLIALMGGVSLLKVGVMNSLFNQVIDERVPSIATTNEVKGDLNLISIALRNTMMMRDADGIKTEVNRIEAARVRINANLARLDAQTTSDTGKAVLARVAQVRRQYDPMQAEVMALVNAGSFFEARTLLMDKVAPAQEAYFETLNGLLTHLDSQLNQSTNATQQAATSMKLVIWAALAIALLLAVLMAAWIIRSITGPLNQAVAVARAVAAGDLSQEFEARGKSETALLLLALKDMQAHLSTVVAEVRDDADSVATASAEIAQGDLDLSARTESQASSLQETSASMELLSANVRQNADNAHKANELALNASSVAARGGDVVSQVVDTMKGINDASRKISDIISVIDGIAFQTNILALNAAVEAARAGEQGRGFAVVASEVRSLAGRSAEAAREIKSLINASVERVAKGTALVDQAGATMSEVVSSIRQVTDIMAEISIASTDQSDGVSQVGEAIAQMDQVTQQNAALVEEMAASAGSLKARAQALVHTVAVFKLGSAEPQTKGGPAGLLRLA